MAKSGWHQTQLDKAHESSRTIAALLLAAQEGAELHLKTVPVTTPAPVAK